MWKVPERWGSASSPHLPSLLFRREHNKEESSNDKINKPSASSSNYLDIVSVTADNDDDDDDDNDSLPALEDFASPRSTMDTAIATTSKSMPSNLPLEGDYNRKRTGRTHSKTRTASSPNKTRTASSPNKTRNASSPNKTRPISPHRARRIANKKDPLARSSSHHSLITNNTRRQRSLSRSNARRQRVRSTSANPTTTTTTTRRQQDPLALSSTTTSKPAKRQPSRNSMAVRTRTRSRSAGPRTGSGRRSLQPSGSKRDSHRMSASARDTAGGSIRKADPLSASCHTLQPQKSNRRNHRRSESHSLLGVGDTTKSDQRSSSNRRLRGDQPQTTVFTMRRCSSGEYAGPPPTSTLRRKETPTKVGAARKRSPTNHTTTRKKREEQKKQGPSAAVATTTNRKKREDNSTGAVRTNSTATSSRSRPKKVFSMRRCTSEEIPHTIPESTAASAGETTPSSKPTGTTTTATTISCTSKMPRRCASEGGTKQRSKLNLKPKTTMSSRKRYEDSNKVPLDPIMDVSQMTTSEPSEGFEASLHASTLYLVDPTEHDEYDENDNEKELNSSKHSVRSNSSFRKTMVQSLQLTSLLGSSSNNNNDNISKSSPNLANLYNDTNVDQDNKKLLSTLNHRSVMTKGLSESLLGGQRQSSNPNLLSADANHHSSVNDMGSILRKSLVKSFQQNVLGKKPSHNSSSDPNLLPALGTAKLNPNSDNATNATSDAASRNSRKNFVQNLLGERAAPLPFSHRKIQRHSDPTIVGIKNLAQAQDDDNDEADEDDTIQSVEPEEIQDRDTTEPNDPKQVLQDARKLVDMHIPGVLVDVPKKREKKRQVSRASDADAPMPLLPAAASGSRPSFGRRFPPKAKSEDMNGTEPAPTFKKKLYRRAKSCNMEAIAVDKRRQMSSKTLVAEAPKANKTPTANSPSVIGFESSPAVNTSRGQDRPVKPPQPAPTDALRTNSRDSESEGEEEPVQTVVIAGIVLAVPPSKEPDDAKTSGRWESEPTRTPKSRWDSE